MPKAPVIHGIKTATASKEEQRREAAKLILQANLKNLTQKVANGKTLTAFEVSQVRELVDDNEGGSAKAWAKNQVELADALNIDRKTIQRWRREADFPSPQPDGRWNVAAVKAWAAAHQRKGGESEESENTKEALEIRRLRTVCERLEYDYAVSRGEYLSRDEVVEEVARMVSIVRRKMLGLPGALAPRLAGLDVPQIQIVLKESVLDALKSLSNEEWKEGDDARFDENDTAGH